MTRPIIGILGNRHVIGETYAIHGLGSMMSEAVAQAANAVPVMIPASPEFASVEEWMGICDGFVFPGGRSNVHPEEYGHEPTTAHGDFDRDRDYVAMSIMRASIDIGLPILAICRGFQELNVAMGGTLHPEIRDLPGRMNHRMPPDGTLDEKFALRHEVRFTKGGVFAQLMEAEVVLTNSLHGQGIIDPGPRVVIDGWADDQTPEAIYIDGAPGYALGVQWHPEYKAAEDPVSRRLFEGLGTAAREWAARKSPELRRIA